MSVSSAISLFLLARAIALVISSSIDSSTLSSMNLSEKAGEDVSDRKSAAFSLSLSLTFLGTRLIFFFFFLATVCCDSMIEADDSELVGEKVFADCFLCGVGVAASASSSLSESSSKLGTEPFEEFDEGVGDGAGELRINFESFGNRLLAKDIHSGFSSRSAFNRSMGLRRMLGSAMIFWVRTWYFGLAKALEISGSFMALAITSVMSGPFFVLDFEAVVGGSTGSLVAESANSVSMEPLTIMRLTSSMLSAMASLNLSMSSGSKPLTKKVTLSSNVLYGTKYFPSLDWPSSSSSSPPSLKSPKAGEAIMTSTNSPGSMEEHRVSVMRVVKASSENRAGRSPSPSVATWHRA
mmetsp:Transcript_14472/g.26748  ORF Transcript_14472/g.26748 Transcript_14472/m.26748 type:complete len:352 (-) Transcript_14472:1854-2909(-)